MTEKINLDDRMEELSKMLGVVDNAEIKEAVKKVMKAYESYRPVMEASEKYGTRIREFQEVQR